MNRKSMFFVLALLVSCCGHSGDAPRAYSPDLGLGDTVDLVLIPRGERMIGSDGADAHTWEIPEVWFRLDYILYLGRTEVTTAQWERMMGKYPKDSRPDWPVTVSWTEAMEFCKRFERLLAQRTGREWECRLPKEAEWEYAARYGLPPGSAWCVGKDPETGWFELGKCAWFRENSRDHVHPVALKEPNTLGLFDMLGNVGEWCFGRFAIDKNVTQMLAESGNQPSEDDSHPYRGGDWISAARECRPSTRSGERNALYNGFRIAAIPKSGASPQPCIRVTLGTQVP
jgi:formylglycine-generating enzyme required for sulfatase activity